MHVSQLLTYGIGTPGDIPHLVLLGLTPTGPVADIPFLCAHLTVRAATATLATAAATATLTTKEC